LRDHFMTRDHFFLVFEMYGDSLSTVLNSTRISSIPMYQAKEITRQLLQAIRFLHDHGIVHTDLRPSNVLFVSNETVTQTFYGMSNAFRSRTVLKSTEIRVVDFGSVCEDAASLSGLVGLAGYRAPEVMMQWRWTNTVDHFALGCIIVRILTYMPLFSDYVASTAESIAVMDRILGPFSDEMVADIEKEYPSAFAHRSQLDFQFSYEAAKYLETAKTISVRTLLCPRNICSTLLY
ncbi:kinase-like domain-containing protein, partial [Mycena crocata]